MTSGRVRILGDGAGQLLLILQKPARSTPSWKPCLALPRHCWVLPVVNPTEVTGPLPHPPPCMFVSHPGLWTPLTYPVSYPFIPNGLPDG